MCEKRKDYISWDEYFMGVAVLSSHAEFNAILNSRGSVRDCKIYVTLFPCNECAKAIIQSGIKEVIYMDDKYDGALNNLASKRLFNLAGVKYRKYEGRKIDILLKDYEKVD